MILPRVLGRMSGCAIRLMLGEFWRREVLSRAMRLCGELAQENEPSSESVGLSQLSLGSL